MNAHTTPERVIIFDTTLRDGEQSPGATMALNEKIRIAEVLEGMGVDVIEAGFPIASNGDFKAVNEIAKIVTNSTVCGLARTTRGDIERAAEAIRPASQGRIHTFISTSPLHMKYKLQMEPETVLEKIRENITLARTFTSDVEWSAEDGSRTEHDFLCRCVETAINAGAKTINIPDTVGYTVPDEYEAIIRMLFNRVPNIDKAVISVHCHNDLGLAVANSLAALQAGARQIECTMNGLGERAGNAAMEEIVMGLKTRHDRMPFVTGVDTTQIMKASRLVSNITGFPIQPNKAVIGANAFAHESGIHQDGVLKHAQTYEIMTPESVGLVSSTLVLGKHSGRHAFRDKLLGLGYDLDDEALNNAFKCFKGLTDRKKKVFDDDIIALVDDAMARLYNRVRLVNLRITCGAHDHPAEAKVTLGVDGEERTATTTGDGPVDAAFNAVKELFPHEAELKLFQIHAVTQGTDAQADVSVRLDEQGHISNGHGADTDSLLASVKAYLNALNNLLVQRERRASKVVSA